MVEGNPDVVLLFNERASGETDAPFFLDISLHANKYLRMLSEKKKRKRCGEGVVCIIPHKSTNNSNDGKSDGDTSAHLNFGKEGGVGHDDYDVHLQVVSNKLSSQQYLSFAIGFEL